MAENVNDARRSADYTARTVDEAVRRAAEDLNLSPEDLDYTVIKDTTHTILGLVRTGEATIRVWASAAPEVQPDVDAGGDVAVEEPTPRPVEAVEEPEPEEVPPAPAPQVTREQDEHTKLASIASDVVSRLVDGMGLLAAVEVVDRGGAIDPVTKETTPVQINIVGDDLGALIGRRGETLRDLQFITRLVVSRQLGEWPNLVVDVEGYKARRAETLTSLAQRMAARVRETGESVTLEPMPAYERRIVHIALRDDAAVYTESTGEGDARKVQILPK